MSNTLALLFCLVATAFAAPTFPQVRPFYGSLIVGGTEAREGEFPYQISLQKHAVLGRYHFCGGSILSGTSILIAAHCLVNQNHNDFTVVVGEHDLTKTSGHEQELSPSQFVTHRSYNSRDMSNDVAVIHLKGSISFNTYVQRTNLPRAGKETATGTSCTVTGWGTLSEGGSSPAVLNKVHVPVVSDADCNKSYNNGIVSSMICAGYTLGGKDSCQGDSGGPFYCGGEQIGIVSWGQGCARPGYPGVYTQVSYFIDWINANTI